MHFNGKKESERESEREREREGGREREKREINSRSVCIYMCVHIRILYMCDMCMLQPRAT